MILPRSGPLSYEDRAAASTEARVEWLMIVGDPDVWRAIGLMVSSDGFVALFGTSLRIVGPSDDDAVLGPAGWAFSGIAETTDLAGFPAEVVAPRPPLFAAHELGAAQLDHVVIFTCDLDAVSTAVEAAAECGSWSRYGKVSTASVLVG